MTDRESFFEHVPATLRHAFDRLPLSVRVADRLTHVLVFANELREQLRTSEAAPLQWIAPEIDRVFAEANTLLNRLSS